MGYKKLFLTFLLTFICFGEEKLSFEILYKKWEKSGKRNPFEFKEEKIMKEKKFESIIIDEPPDFKVNGIIYSKDKSYILVGEKIFKEGDEINGFVLKKIYPDYVIFEKNGKLYKLTTEAENVEKE
jgi:type II secretory pathway component PulC